MQNLHGLKYLGLGLVIRLDFIGVFRWGTYVKFARVGRYFLDVGWKMLRWVGKGKKVMLKCGCGIY